MDEVAQGLALLVEEYLHEDDVQVRTLFLQTLNKIIMSRPYAVGRRIDWEALIQRLSHASWQEVRSILIMLKYANDEKYLLVLETYFSNPSLRPLAAKSWIPLAYYQIYGGDPRVWPYLENAYWMITGRNAPVPLQEGKPYVDADREELIKELNKQWEQRPVDRIEMMQILSDTRQKILHEVLVQRAGEQPVQEKSEDIVTFVNLVRSWLQIPDKKIKIWEIQGLHWSLEEELSLFIDDVAQVVGLLVHAACKEEDLRTRWAIWSVVHKAFLCRIYVGTYLDWQMLAEHLPQLASDELRYVLFDYGYAPDESYFSVLEPYLEHSDSDVRSTAAQAICHLIYHVSRYSPQVSKYFQEASRAMEEMKETLDSPEYRDTIWLILHEFQQKARPHYKYYSI